MNAAWVGVIGAAVGGGIAGMTAIGTSYFQLRLSKAQLKAQKDEAERQRRFEGRRDRRDARQQAYTDFLSASQHLHGLLTKGDLTETVFNEEMERLNKLSAGVGVVGPQETGKAARDVTLSMLRALTYIRDPSTLDMMGVLHLVTTSGASISVFVEAARAALEDDGQPPEVNS